MGIHIIKMPDLGEGIAEVEVVEWRVKPGDTVKEDQVLADVMTDKATVEIPSPVNGTVIALGGEIGESLAVGAELIRLEVAGSGNQNGKTATPATATATAGTTLPGSPVSTVCERAEELEEAPAPVAKAAPAQAPLLKAAPPRARGLAAPAVRQRALELGIALEFLEGSGPEGRITHADLDAQLLRRVKVAPSGPKPSDPTDAERTIAVTGMRRKIAQKMQEAKRRIPHFTYVEEVDVTELEALRAHLNGQHGNQRGRITLLPLLMRAIVLSLKQFPQANARFNDESGIVTQYDAVHIGVATQTAAGLMVPVVRNAHKHDLWSSALEVARLAEAARAGKAVRDELSGSTITITSLGALGGIVTTPVINHPEVAIIGVNKMVERPMIRDGAIVARKMMNLSSSFDHRVIDGMVAAQFVQTIRAYLETPATLFID
ncbi:dihydrolipoamide acetyltransferase family protein [Massilia sp. S19_KUP03_FR1]|uniref:dihydrolipoamide acetyltransferase family protein n=1 Tax=Massilia sp. S19_KUP03_FR1 TaxID=3025503 RepID=UPI002FCCF4FF